MYTYTHTHMRKAFILNNQTVYQHDESLMHVDEHSVHRRENHAAPASNSPSILLRNGESRSSDNLERVDDTGHNRTRLEGNTAVSSRGLGRDPTPTNAKGQADLPVRAQQPVPSPSPAVKLGFSPRGPSWALAMAGRESVRSQESERLDDVSAAPRMARKSVGNAVRAPRQLVR